jgi:hypothetical protein
MKNNFAVPGSLAAAFLSSSIAIILMGVMVYLREEVLNSILGIYPVMGTFGGIWLYSYLIWLVLWIVLYFALRRRASMGSLSTWTNFFIVAALLGIFISLASLEWMALFE